MILSGKTVKVTFSDGRSETVQVTNRDELRFEQSQRISLAKVLTDDEGLPLWVAAGIIHWRLLRSDVEDIPADLDEFMDMLDPDAWLEVVDEGKAQASGSTQPTG